MNNFINNQFKILFVVALTMFSALPTWAEVRPPQFAKHEHIAKITDTGKLTIVKNLNPETIKSNRITSANLIQNKNYSFTYCASRSNNSMIPVINICDAVLSCDQTLLILLESLEVEDNKYLNRLIFFDTEDNRVINAFEFKNAKSKYSQAWLTPENLLIIEEFNPSTQKNTLNFYPLQDKNFEKSVFTFSINQSISDLIVNGDTIFVKLTNQNLLAFDTTSLVSITQCRGEAGKLLLTSNNEIINIILLKTIK